MKKLKLTIPELIPPRNQEMPQLPKSIKGEKPILMKGLVRTPKQVASKLTISLANGVPPLKLSQTRTRELKSRNRSALNSTKSSNIKKLDLKLSSPVSKRSPKSVRGVQTHLLLKNNVNNIQKHSTNYPITPKKALDLFPKDLTEYEATEINQYKQIWYFGLGVHKISSNSSENNFGYDDNKGDYIPIKGDHIAYRYELIGNLGKGSFGKVVRAFDHKEKEEVALKIIKNKPKFFDQAQIEIKILSFLQKSSRVVNIKDSFSFRNHVCISFEVLGNSLYDILEKNKFEGFPIRLIHKFALQILQCLAVQETHKIIHCDLKPENILLESPSSTDVKMIDYGSSCFEDEQMYSYIQSRFYRAPEVILGIKYTCKIDIWSLGCLLTELFIGKPLFAGDSECEQIAMFIEFLGAPPLSLLNESTRKSYYFDTDNNPYMFTNRRGKSHRSSNTNINHVFRNADSRFVNFVLSCLQWDPKLRISAKEAMNHEWIRSDPGLPCVDKIRSDNHLRSRRTKKSPP